MEITREQVVEALDGLRKDGISSLPDFIRKMSEADEVSWLLELHELALRALDDGSEVRLSTVVVGVNDRDTLLRKLAELECIACIRKDTIAAFAESLAWKTIDSAPTDTLVLICVHGCPDVEIARLLTDGRWYSDLRGELINYPTHWKPMPEALGLPAPDED